MGGPIRSDDPAREARAARAHCMDPDPLVPLDPDQDIFEYVPGLVADGEGDLDSESEEESVS